MRTTVIAGLALLAAAAPLAAQGGGMAMGNDPTKKVTGSGKLPDGWTLRFDPARVRPNAPPPPAPQMTDVNFVTMGTGYHVTSGPAAIYYNPAHTATGEYAVTATFAQRKSMGHEAYGIFIGGGNLQDSTQHYLYFVVRPFDGNVLIRYRGSDARPRDLMAYTPDSLLKGQPVAGVNKEDPTSGAAKNTLTIHVAKDAVHFLVNDKLVKELKKSELQGISTDGQAGLRINHNLDLHIDKFEVKK